MHDPVALLLLLVAAHAVCDFPLQGDFLSNLKRPDFAAQMGNRKLHLAALALHSSVHAAAVLLITGQSWLALLQLVSHFVIDLTKSIGLQPSLWRDQLAHAAVLWFTWLCLIRLAS